MNQSVALVIEGDVIFQCFLLREVDKTSVDGYSSSNRALRNTQLIDGRKKSNVECFLCFFFLKIYTVEAFSWHTELAQWLRHNDTLEKNLYI